MKLEVNHDRFRNEAAKVIYAVSRLAERVPDQVIPLINGKSAAPFDSITTFIAHLKASFGDLDPRGTTRGQLVTLKQGKRDFATYYSQFLCIVTYLNYNKGAKIDVLAEGLSEDLKDTMTYWIDRTNIIEAYATIFMTIDNQIRSRKAKQRAIRNTMGQFTARAAVAHPSHTAGDLPPMDLSVLQTCSAQCPADEQQYTFVNGQRKTSTTDPAIPPIASSASSDR
ncbi:uncharacterized protein H6S33_012273 [Morchella sextelata]|uniref:uncharacterized protein n=1 Tax=Morchella sextelata TaxID=1174677 RepID=UPI001D04882F|nr:uncharacterized protein H6S33_012273 [Morchella sextelata]KAH0609727.1 hypothetical protein H6S33_012273 [Morchella sextelata]